jgi:glycosyltransferase involved in cell wall biosynthesis
MKVSVVIPCYNESKMLPRLFDSLRIQTVLPDEIIVVDNNSTDNSVEIAKRYGARVIHEREQGIIPARNTGFGSATGDIMIRTDGDSVLPQNWVEKFVHKFQDPMVVAVGGPVVYNELRVPRFVLNKIFDAYYSTTHIIYGRPILYGPNFGIRKDVWHLIKDELELMDWKVHEDMEMSYKLSRYGEVVFDYSLTVGTSHRRAIRKPFSMFVEYPYRGIKTWLRVKNIIK